MAIGFDLVGPDRTALHLGTVGGVILDRARRWTLASLLIVAALLVGASVASAGTALSHLDAFLNHHPAPSRFTDVQLTRCPVGGVQVLADTTSTATGAVLDSLAHKDAVISWSTSSNDAGRDIRCAGYKDNYGTSVRFDVWRNHRAIPASDLVGLHGPVRVAHGKLYYKVTDGSQCSWGWIPPIIGFTIGGVFHKQGMQMTNALCRAAGKAVAPMILHHLQNLPAN